MHFKTEKAIGRSLRILITVAVIAVISGSASLLWANPKKMDLEQKVADMALLRNQLSDRLDQAKALREKLRHQKQSLIDEISVLCRTHTLTRFEDADQYLRIHYNFQLISELEAYLEQIESKITFFETGKNKLAYLQKSAMDDIRMIDTLNDLQVDALTTQVSLVINHYLTEAHTIQLNPDDIKSPSPRQVWESVRKGDDGK